VNYFVGVCSTRSAYWWCAAPPGEGYVHGGFVGGDTSITTTGRGRPYRPGARAAIKPADATDLTIALKAAIAPAGAVFKGPLASQPRYLDPYFADAARRRASPRGVIRAIARRETGFLNYRPTATSPVGALGIMQTMPDWWAHGGDWRDPRQNIMMGAKALRAKKLELEGRLGRAPSWDMVAGAYNAGTSGVLDHNAIERYSETRNYVKLFHDDYLQLAARPHDHG